MSFDKLLESKMKIFHNHLGGHHKCTYVICSYDKSF